MAYTKQTWVDGEVITAGKLNHIEDGLAGVAMVIDAEPYGEDSQILNKTWLEIKNALLAGALCEVRSVFEDDGILNIALEQVLSCGDAQGLLTIATSMTEYTAETENSYPIADGGK